MKKNIIVNIKYLFNKLLGGNFADESLKREYLFGKLSSIFYFTWVK